MNQIFVTIVISLFAISLFAQEIVQWRGDNRDGKYNETGLLKSWPEKGPEMIWHFDGLGVGHGSAAVTENTVYTSGTLDDKGYVFAFDHSGKLKWKTEYGKEWMENWDGVRTTPLVYNDKIYIMSSYAEMFCMNAEDGSIIWKEDLLTKYNGRNIQWGITENLVIHDNKVYCTLGGEEANVIALNIENGELVWKNAGNGEMSAYCSPTVINHKGQNIFITMTENSIIGFDANSGDKLWSHEQTNKYSVHANTPLYHEGKLYCVSGYGKGGAMLQIADDGKSVTELWFNESLDNRMGGVVLLDGKIYGSGDNNKNWYILDWETGNEVYAENFMKKGNVIFADGMLYCYGEGGEVALLEPLGDSFKVKGKFAVPYGEKWHWAHLVINNKKLYVRHGASLMVYNISQ